MGGNVQERTRFFLVKELTGNIGLLRQKVIDLLGEKSKLTQQIGDQKVQFDEAKVTHRLQINSLSATISGLQSEVSHLEFSIIEKNLQAVQIDKENQASVQYISYLRSVISELDRQIGVLMTEISRLDLAKQILETLDTKIIIAQVKLDTIEADIVRLGPERSAFEIEKAQFQKDKALFDLDRAKFDTEAWVLAEALKQVQSREANVTRIELAQLHRGQKSSLKITAEKLNGV